MSLLGRLAMAVVAAVAVVAALVALSDATKYRGERGRPGEQTSVTFEVDTRRYGHGHAATALWYTCIGTLGPGAAGSPHEQADGTYRAWIRPALGEDARRRLRGCLRDATLDRVRGEVVAMVNEPVAADRSGPRPPVSPRTDPSPDGRSDGAATEVSTG